MKINFKKLWKFSWLITLPISLFFIYWGWATIDRYTTFKVSYRTYWDGMISLDLLEIGEMEFSHLLRRIKLSLSRNKDENINLKTVNLFVPDSKLNRLNSDLPHSGFEYVKGGVWNNGKLNRVKVRYRGDYNPHWAYYKKSIRVKTRKKSLFEGMRTFNLIVPQSDEQIMNYTGYKLADKLGLISPRTELVNVTINGEITGLYFLAEQLKEITLRSHNLMPGDIYVGELRKKDRYTGANDLIFEYPGLWEKNAYNNHYDKDSRKPLEALLKIINSQQTEESQRELSRILDMESWGKFSVFETLFQTWHYDNDHNWRLYYDPWKGKFYPIVWDPAENRQIKFPVHLDVIPSMLHYFLFNNGDFLRARSEAIADFFLSGKDRSFIEEVDDIIIAAEPVIRQDPNTVPADPSRLIKAMKSYRNTLRQIFNDVRLGFMHNGRVLYQKSSHNNILSVSVTGRKPVNKLILNYLMPLNSRVSAGIKYWQNEKMIEKDISGALSFNETGIEIKTGLLARFVQTDTKISGKNKFGLKVKPSYYELFLTGIQPGNQLLEVLVDDGEGKLKPAERVNNLKRIPFRRMYPLIKSQPVTQPVVWEKTVEVDGVREFYNELVIQPGTTVRMKPGATLILHNRLLAQGTPRKPIRFLPATEGQEPWGALVLKGRGADGSRISNCEFAGGSGLKGDLFEYSAMFSVHNVQGVKVNRCRFRDSKIVDDMVHAVYSDIRFIDSEFIRAVSDAVDLDISRGVFDRCRFVNSGNDSIDLMTTQAVVVDTLIQNSGDKAISVGENSRLLALNSSFSGNQIGVQSKDSSVAVLYNVDLKDNAHALDAYKKNWQYDIGGKIFLYKGRISGNRKTITAGKKSWIWVYDTFLDRPISTDNKKKKEKIKQDETVDSGSREEAREKGMWRYPEEMQLMKEIEWFSLYWQMVRPSRRGASKINYEN